PGGARLMTVTSTYDHRIIQGAESGSFLRTVDELLQSAEFYQGIAQSMAVASGPAATPAQPPRVTPAAPLAWAPAELLQHVAAAVALVRAHRTHGYLAATLDPLGTEPKGDPALDPANVDLTPEIMQQIPAGILRVYVPGQTLADVLPRLRE